MYAIITRTPHRCIPRARVVARIQRVRTVTERFTLAAVRCRGPGHDLRLIRVRAHSRNTADVCLIRLIVRRRANTVCDQAVRVCVRMVVPFFPMANPGSSVCPGV